MVRSGRLGFEPSRGALRTYWSDVANALLCLRMRRNHTAITLNQDWARKGNAFPYFSPAGTGWARLSTTCITFGGSGTMVKWQTR